MVIELKDVTKRYGTGPVSVTALHDVELFVDAGEFVVVLGPSGSGKTTLLNVIGALDTPSGGTVRVNGVDISAASRRELFDFRRTSVTFVFQAFNLFTGLTAQENVQFGVDAGESPLDAADVLHSVGLGDKLDRFPHELSGGEQQRVAIARALATNNPIMLADEPTGELDFETGVQILGLLQEQAGNGRAVLVVTHNREISRIADRVIELSSGRVVSDGPPLGGKADVADLHW
ncbi:MAG: ABC transporter ATP-binding protein [Acidimicrobiia bacterium]|nr:ABC transporter ATP-binding protein [Acidimicrobiia bacterium]